MEAPGDVCIIASRTLNGKGKLYTSGGQITFPVITHHSGNNRSAGCGAPWSLFDPGF